MKELLNRGVIGKVISARVEAGQYLPDWHPGEDYRKGYAARKALGGGVILTLIHEIDYLSWFLGKPRAVFCFADHLSDLKLDVEDVAEILIRFRGGAVGEVHLDYIQRTPSRSAQIIGTKGTMRWDYFKGELRVYSAKTKKWIVYRDPKNFDRNMMFLDEMKQFLACVRGKKQTTIPLSEGVASLRTALAAKRSAKQHSVISL
jgi:predicted dehydrogenase